MSTLEEVKELFFSDIKELSGIDHSKTILVTDSKDELEILIFYVDDLEGDEPVKLSTTKPMFEGDDTNPVWSYSINNGRGKETNYILRHKDMLVKINS